MYKQKSITLNHTGFPNKGDDIFWTPPPVEIGQALSQDTTLKSQMLNPSYWKSQRVKKSLVTVFVSTLVLVFFHFVIKRFFEFINIYFDSLIFFIYLVIISLTIYIPFKFSTPKIKHICRFIGTNGISIHKKESDEKESINTYIYSNETKLFISMYEYVRHEDGVYGEKLFSKKYKLDHLKVINGYSNTDLFIYCSYGEESSAEKMLHLKDIAFLTPYNDTFYNTQDVYFGNAIESSLCHYLYHSFLDSIKNGESKVFDIVSAEPISQSLKDTILKKSEMSLSKIVLYEKSICFIDEKNERTINLRNLKNINIWDNFLYFVFTDDHPEIKIQYDTVANCKLMLLLLKHLKFENV
jgi:hypothetical protein